MIIGEMWSGRRDSNSRPRPWQGRALPLSYFRTDRAGSCPRGSLPAGIESLAAAADTGESRALRAGSSCTNRRWRLWRQRPIPLRVDLGGVGPNGERDHGAHLVRAIVPGVQDAVYDHDVAGLLQAQKKRPVRAASWYSVGAQDEIRTHTPLRTLPPQDSASANSATWARPRSRWRSECSVLAGVEGLEPTTCGFGDRCSAN